MDSSLVQAILTTGGTGIAVAFTLLVTGVIVPGYAYRRLQQEVDRRDDVIDKLRDTLESERREQNAMVRSGTVTNQLIEALVEVKRGPDGGSGGTQARRRR